MPGVVAIYAYFVVNIPSSEAENAILSEISTIKCKTNYLICINIRYNINIK